MDSIQKNTKKSSTRNYSQGYVYVFLHTPELCQQLNEKCGAFFPQTPIVKIGYTCTTPEARKAIIGGSHPLTLLHGIPVASPLKIERQIHEIFHGLAIGHEWFLYDAPSMEAFPALIAWVQAVPTIWARTPLPSGLAPLQVLQHYHASLTALTLGNCLRKLREERGLTQKGLSKRSHLSTALISGLEWHTSNPRLSTLRALATAFDMPFMTLMRTLEDIVPSEEMERSDA